MNEMNYQSKIEFNQKYIIMEQIQAVNTLINGFDSSGTPISSAAQLYAYEFAAQQGKKIANSILCLEALVFPLMTKEFMEKKEVNSIRDIAFLTVDDFVKKYKVKDTDEYHADGILFGDGYADASKLKWYMQKNLAAQQIGIERLIDYYRVLLSFVFSLQEFQTTKTVSSESESADLVEVE